LDELVGNRVVVALWDGFEVLVHLISEYYKSRKKKMGGIRTPFCNKWGETQEER
jgi:hypothetical protein